MIMLLVLLPVSALLIGVALASFFWAADDGQFDDLDAPAFAPMEEDRRGGSP